MKSLNFLCVCYWMEVSTMVHSLIVPTFYVASLIDTARINGSSPTGHCVGYDVIAPNAYCNAPGSSVLFDSHTPTLSPLDGGAWASELLTLRTEANINLFESYISMLFLFHNQREYTGVNRMELVFFNCPQWGISVGSVEVSEFSSEKTTTIAIQSIDITSCHSVVRACVPMTTNSTNLQVKFLSVPSPKFYVYLAELAFYADSSTCPPEALAPTERVTTTEVPTDPVTNSSPSSNLTPCPTSSEACPSCPAANSWAPVVSAIGTVLLAVLIFALIQIAVCKNSCRGRRVDTAAGEDPMYEEISETNEGESVSKLNTLMTTTPNMSYSVNPLVLHAEQLSGQRDDPEEPFYDYMVLDR